jgi:hypothetical protein
MARHELSLKYSSKAVTDLLRFYVIFRPVENKEDTTLSPCQTVLSVSMDDSLQFRCAGTIQAAIEKYIDHIGGKQPTREDDASSDLSTVEDAEEGEEPQKKQKQRRTLRARAGEICELTPYLDLRSCPDTCFHRVYC